MLDVKPRSLLPVAVVTLALGLAFQGSRGLWEPDEGRNVNIALGMLASSDWLIPRLNGEIYLDKPPLHYWSLAAGLRLLGANEWAARLPQAGFFLLTVGLVGALAGRMWDRATAALAALVYATTLVPFVAANVLTPDTPLAAFLALFYYAYWRAETAAGPRVRLGWWLAAGFAAGLGLLTKGPAVLVFLPPLLLHLLLRRRLPAVLREPGVWLGAGLALVLGALWYVPVAASLPGASAYLFDNQVTGRLVTADYRRNPGWAGAVKVYLPILTLGALPWSAWWCWRGPRFLRLRQLAGRPASLLLFLWFVLPLPVFLLASSRLPLYLLPLFAPFAIATGRALVWTARAAGPAVRKRHRAFLAVAVWCLLLLAAKGWAAWRGSYRDARERAAWLRSEAPAGGRLVAVDVHANGLRLYGYPSILWATSERDPYPLFSPLPTLEEVAPRLLEEGRPSMIVVPRHRAEGAWRRLAGAGLACAAGRPSERLAVLVCERPAGAGMVAARGGG